ncbi:hypothetical protein P168DRAFT_290444 [Aspergillus campestris IBT 28561]|uniref:Uncharacterized protein n=1 Tax=Aspergillus campestris (strain IBT 28561) TaxID=1392248 RepID=A0A2I1D3D2_ASPC2|nr:uncharacterized protein P168DRAFT_290444 [Aspergillus campestris IBT 28561]PKY04366.1 hypothetical protein P168DRAFT_290444 [Aspergillus campestris IBT 28561]
MMSVTRGFLVELEEELDSGELWLEVERGAEWTVNSDWWESRSRKGTSHGLTSSGANLHFSFPLFSLLSSLFGFVPFFCRSLWLGKDINQSNQRRGGNGLPTVTTDDRQSRRRTNKGRGKSTGV